MPSMVRLAVAAIVVCLTGTALSDPFVGYCYPCGMEAGTTVRVIVGGQNFGGVRYAWVSGEGVRIVDVEHVPEFTRAPGDGQVKWVGEWIRNLDDGISAMPELPKDEILRNWPRNRWWESLDKLDAISMALVKRNHFLPRPDPLQAAPAIAQKLILTIESDKTALPGARELVVCSDAGASAPHPFFVSKEKHVAEPLFASPPRKNKPVPVAAPRVYSTPVVLDGQIFPGETDRFSLELVGGTTLVCLLTGRELVPYLGDAVPGFFNPVMRLVDPDGNEVAFADDYRYLPDPVMSCKIGKSGVYQLEVRDNLYRGRDDFVYSVECYSDGRQLPTPAERAFLCRPRPEVRGEKSGVLAFSKACVSYDFKVDECRDWCFELFARRIGSPLDGVMRLYGPLSGETWKSGPLLATWDDVTNRLYVGTVPQAECDPVGSWTFKEPGEYRIEVSDRVGGGDADYGFTLDVSPMEPSFEVYATKSAFVMRPWRGQSVSFKVRVVRKNGFKGAVRIEGGDGLMVKNGEIAADQDEAKVTVEQKGDVWSGMKRAVFTAEARLDNGKTIRNRVIPCNEVEQAFAYTHVIPAFDFLFYMTPRNLLQAEPPEWIDMPYDKFLPRRIIHAYADASAYKTDYVRAMDELSKVQAVVGRSPSDANDSLLAAKFFTSAMRIQSDSRRGGRTYRSYAIDNGNANDVAAARAVLAGYVGMVDPQMSFSEGNQVRVRTMAHALKLPHDNDMLVYVPKNGNPLVGAVGASIRRLHKKGCCFDFVTDLTLTNAPCGHVYKTVFMPAVVVPPETKQLLDEYSRRNLCKVVYEKDRPKEIFKLLKERSRRENIPEIFRFARFGRRQGEGWYFVHNPTAARQSADCGFNIRGRAVTAYAMNVKTGKIDLLPKGKKDQFTLTLESGSSAWVYVTAKAAPNAHCVR